MKQELDSITLGRARRGDAGAFRALYLHHADLVHAFVRRMLRDEAAVEDVLQECFVRVYRALPRFDDRGPGRLSTWILTIARRVALTALAGRTHRREAEAPMVPGSERATHPCHDLRLTLESAIAALPEAMRSTFVLRECLALSYEEVAIVEGVDLGTVKSRLHRARAALQATLGEAEADEPPMQARVSRG